MKDWIKGMDLSSLQEVEHCGGKFYDHGQQGDAMDILQKYGMNLVRLRLWNHPYGADGRPYGGGGNDLTTVLSLAKRAGERGIGWLLDFHYSDSWADPGKQVLPKAWTGMGQAQLEEAVYRYTAWVMEAVRREGILPRMAAIGNEVTNGILWPYGKVPNYRNLARLISAGIRAVRDTAPEVLVMIHLDDGGNNGLYRNWFDQYLDHGGEDFDLIGLSYYPFWHGTLAMLEDNMNDIALRYHKDLVLAEVSMAHTMEDYQQLEGLSDSKRKGMAANAGLAGQVPFAMTPRGQAQFLEAIFKIIEKVPEHRGLGFCYWEPAWLPVPGSGWASEAAIEYLKEKGPGGNEWANQGLFDYQGNALPALEAIRVWGKEEE